MANELIPCRFCNKKVNPPGRIIVGGMQPYKLRIKCEPCGLTMVFYGKSWKVMMEEIYKRWNRVIKEETIGYE